MENTYAVYATEEGVAVVAAVAPCPLENFSAHIPKDTPFWVLTADEIKEVAQSVGSWDLLEIDEDVAGEPAGVGVYVQNQ